MQPRISMFGLVAASALAFSALGLSQSRVPDRLTAPLVMSQRTVINAVHPLATRQNDLGRLASNQVFPRMVLTLQRSPAQETALQQLLAEQQDPKSPQFHHWLTPTEFGQRFGVSDNDLAKVTGWLRAQGFAIDRTSTGRQYILFTGTSAQVETAFQTEMHRYGVNGKTYLANAKPASIPTALAPAVSGVASLNSFGKLTWTPQYHMAAAPTAQVAGGYLTGPGDLAAIYDATPLQQKQIQGQGQSIALIEESDIDVQDVNDFRTLSGLPAAKVNVIYNGVNPGKLLSDGEETEAIADVEYAGALAPDATLNVIVTASTPLLQGIDFSMLYAVDYDISPITSLSYGGCEAYELASGLFAEMALYKDAYEQGAAEGISHFVAAGDYGGSGCGYLGAYGISPGYGVNGIGQTPWNVSVGGTEFVMPNPDTYFPAANQYQASGYIPESAWNDYQNPIDGRPIAGGGGPSIGYPKPAWQAGPGVPADGQRDTPDVSLLAGDNLAYLVCQRDIGADCSQGQPMGIIGTSLASPAWAGIQALVNQKNNLMNGAGNPNPTYYMLAAGSNSPFHDTTVGDTRVPNADGSLVGYQTTTGYDLATGLGSVDVNALATAWAPPTGSGQSTVTLDTGGVSTLTHGDPLTANMTVAANSGTTVPTGDVVLMAATQGVYQATLDSTGKATAGFGVTGSGTELPGGSYNLVAKYAGDANFAPASSAPIALTVNPEATQTLVSSSTAVAVPYGVPITLYASATGLNSKTGFPVPGTYTFTEGGNTLGTAPLLDTGERGAPAALNVAASLTLTGAQTLKVGTHTINASSPAAGASYLASTSTTPVVVQVVPSSVLVSLTPDHANPAVNAPLHLHVSVLNLNGMDVPVAGTVNVYDGSPTSIIASGTLGTKPDAAGGFDVDLPVSFSAAGVHDLVAYYVGDGNNASGLSGAVDITVGGGAGSGTLMSTSSTIAAGAGLMQNGPTYFAMAQNSVTLSAQVSNDSGSTTQPTGTITFVDVANSNAAVGTASVASDGSATLTTNKLTGGNHFIVAKYSGDGNYAASSSQSLNVQIGDFNVTVNPGSASVAAGQSTSVTLTYSSSFDFTQLPSNTGAGSVVLSCSGLPQGSDCSFSSAVINPAGSGAALSGTSTVTINTTGPTLVKASNQMPRTPLGGAAPLAFAGVFVLGLPLAFRKRKLFTSLCGLLLLGAVATLNGCNSGPQSYLLKGAGTPAGASTVTVTATINGGSLYGSTTHSATVALNVSAAGN